MSKETAAQLLEAAAGRGNIPECSRLIRECGAHVNGDVDAATASIPLHVAVQSKYAALVRALVRDLGGDVNVRDSRGATACAIAAREAKLAMLRLLVQDLFADPNITDLRGRSPVFLAAMNGHSSAVELLLDLGANPNLPSANGRTPAFVAAQESHISTIRILGEHGASLGQADHEGRTPAFAAAMWGNTAALRLLSLGFCVDMTVVDHNGCVCLR
jgi:ankyrin repeat protein